jgi:hypothetical protein
MSSIQAGVLAAALLASAARAADVDINWDKDLSFDYDRENYQNMLQQIIAMSVDEVARATGITLERRLQINVMNKPRYEQTFGAAFAQRTGAHYLRGVINVNGGSRLGLSFAGGMIHEMTHAFLDYKRSGQLFPAWFNEGLAECLRWTHEGLEALAPNQVMELKDAREHGRLVPLVTNEGAMTPFLYIQSRAAVLYLQQKFGKDAVFGLARKVAGGAPFERALSSELSVSSSDVEGALGAWVDHL